MTETSSYEGHRLSPDHPQHRDVPAIFLLEVIETDELEEGLLSHYPMYHVRTYSLAYATTLADAEILMHQDILYRKRQKETDDWMQDVFCYYISEKPLGFMLSKGEYLSQRMYDAEGRCIDKSLCCTGFGTYSPNICNQPEYDRHNDETFYGRSEEQISFHKGDIVEVLRGHEVRLAVVVGTPPTEEWISKKRKEIQDRMGAEAMPFDFDCSDDSYTVIDGPGYDYHDHVSAMLFFAPHYPIPHDIQEKYKGFLHFL